MQTVEYNGALLLLLLFISYPRNPNQATQTLDTEQVKTQQQNTIKAIQVIKKQHNNQTYKIQLPREQLSASHQRTQHV